MGECPFTGGSSGNVLTLKSFKFFLTLRMYRTGHSSSTAESHL
jgi:hypothetical protein